MKKKIRKISGSILSFALAAAMVMGLSGMTTLAAEGDEEVATTQTIIVKEQADGDIPAEESFSFFLCEVTRAIHPIESKSDITKAEAGADISYTIYDKDMEEVIDTGTTDEFGAFSLHVDECAVFTVPAETEWYVTQNADIDAAATYKLLEGEEGVTAEGSHARVVENDDGDRYGVVQYEPDKSELQTAVDEAKELDSADYTPESWEALEKALENAEAVLEDSSATQDEIDEALKDLQDAIEGLEKIVDKSELQEEYEKDALLKEADYTPESWEPFKEALDKAQEVLNDNDATQDEVDEALKDLEDAKDKLEPATSTVDKSKLQEEFDEDALLKEADYTPDSWKPFEKALEKAQDVLNDDDATQEEVDEALADLKEKKDGLKEAEKADKTALQQEYDEDITLKEDDYTPESWAPFADALEQAKDVLDDEDATQDDVDEALQDLKDAKDALEKVPEPTPALTVSVEVSSDLEDNTKTYDGKAFTLTATAEVEPDTAAVSYQWYKENADGEYEPIEGATLDMLGVDGKVSDSGTYKCVVTATDGDETATAEGVITITIEKAEQEISYEETLIEKKVGDEPFTNKLTVITLSDEEGAGITYESSDETIAKVDPDTGEVTILDDGSVIITATAAGTADYAEATATYVLDIESAPSPSVDKTVLQEEYDEDSTLDESDYTPETWAPFEEALENAKDVLDNDDATQEEVDEALEDLIDARDGLEKVPSVDKSVLQEEYDEDSTLEESDYTPETWAPFEEALAQAKDVLDDDDATQEEVDEALETLIDARNGLEKVPEPVPPTVNVTITSTIESQGNTKTYDGVGVSLTATAVADPDTAEISYQWYKDGEEIDGATFSLLNIDGKVSDSGTYKCVVTATNEGLTATAEDEITITINAAAQDISYATTTVTKVDYDEDFTNELTQTTVYGEITYTSSNTEVATVDATTGEVHIVGTGYTIITATAAGSDNYAEASATYTLTVNTDQVEWEIDVNHDRVTWDEEKEEWVDDLGYTGEDMELEMVITLTEEEEEELASISYQWYRFVPETSDYEPIEGATQDTYTLTGDDINVGDYIYMCMAVVTYSNGYAHTIYSPIEVIIEQAAQDISYTETTITKDVGEGVFTNELTETKVSTDPDAGITYTSSDETVATVDKDGKVTIVGVGTTTITATAAATTNYKGATASYTLTVNDHSWGEVTWTWADDYSSATATRTCTVCGQTESVTTTDIAHTSTATATKAGVTTYTATAKFNDGTEATGTTEADTPAVDPEGYITIVHGDDTWTITNETIDAAIEAAPEQTFTYTSRGSEHSLTAQFVLISDLTGITDFDSYTVTASDGYVTSNLPTDTYLYWRNDDLCYRTAVNGGQGSQWSNGPVTIEIIGGAEEQEAFAVYCAGNNSLTFAYGTAPAEGDTYNGQTVTTVYDNVDSTSLTTGGTAPWSSVQSTVTDVTIDETFKDVQPTSLAYWFDSFSSATFTGLENFDTSEVTDMTSMLEKCTSLTSIDLTKWDLSSPRTGSDETTVNMDSLLYGDTALTSITMAGLDATSVSSFRQLCRGCTALTSVDLTDCVMPNMGCVFAMFRGCTNLESIDLTGVDTSNIPAGEVERFATECDNLKWVKIGEKTDIFRKGAEASQAVVDQATWYDSDVNGKVVSTNYLQDVDEAGQYWTYTTEEGSITIKIGEETSQLLYSTIDAAIEAVPEEQTFTYGSSSVTAKFVKLSDLLELSDKDYCSYTVTYLDDSEEKEQAGLSFTDTYIYKTDSGEYRTAINGSAGRYWIYSPTTIEVITEHTWDVTWTWKDLPVYCTAEGTGFTPISVMDIQLWNVAKSLNIATLADGDDGDPIDVSWITYASATAAGTCSVCNATDDADATLHAEYVGTNYDGKAEPTEYDGILAYIWGTATFKDGQEVAMDEDDYAHIVTPALGNLEVDYINGETTVKDPELIPFSTINKDYIHKVTPYEVKWTTSSEQSTIMPFVPIEEILGIDESENYCCFIPVSYSDGTGNALPHNALLYQRDQSGTYYYRTAVNGAYGQQAWSYIKGIQVQYQHVWGTGEWTWSDDYSSASVYAACTRKSGSGNRSIDVCSHNETVATTDITYKVTTEPTATEPGVGTYTATATMSDGQTLTGTTTVEIPPLTEEAFAVYCEGNESLTFAYGTAPAVGDTYNGQTVTKVYDNVDTVALGEDQDEEEIPWNEIASDVTSVVIDETFESVKPTSLAYWFSDFRIAVISGLDHIDTSEVTSMSDTFNYCSSATVLDVSSWDTSNVTTMHWMFRQCTALTSVGDISEWDTSKVTDVQAMFRRSQISELDLSKWDMGSVTSSSGMFQDCAELTGVGDISEWDTSSMVDIDFMFYGCAKFTSLDLSGWDTSSVSLMSYMFQNCTSLTTVNLEGWDTSNVTSMSSMFYGDTDLTNLDLSKWDTGKVEEMKSVFYNCSSLTDIGDVSSWDTESVTTTNGMFRNTGFESIDLSGWDTSNLQDVNSMFRSCAKLKGIDISGWDTSAVKTTSPNYYGYFATSCSALEWVKIGDKTNIFTRYKNVDQQNWYDSPTNGNLVSENYLQDVDEAGQYWSYTTQAHTHEWEVTWTWTGLPKYVDCDVDGYEHLSIIQPWNVVQSLGIVTLDGNLDDVTATAGATCSICGVTETAKGVLTAEYLSAAPTEYLGALAQITATATFSDEQQATDEKKVIAAATGDLEVDYLKTDGTTTNEVAFSDINTLINNTVPFAVHYTSNGREQTTTMPFVLIETILSNYAESLDGVNYCCFMPYDTGGSSGQPLSHGAYIYQRDQEGTYYYRTAENGAYGQSFWSNLAKIEVVYQHQWGTPDWEWSDDYSSATVTVSCTRKTGSGFVVCTHKCKADAEISHTQEGGYDVYTATATLDDGQVITDEKKVEIPATTEAFAVYCAGNNSLTFAYGTTPAEGDTYNGQTVTTVYDNVDSTIVSSGGNAPWSSVQSTVTDVTIDETFKDAQPTSLAYWFDSFSNATFTGLENIDTSEVTDMTSMLEKCTSLESIDLTVWDLSTPRSGSDETSVNMDSLLYGDTALTSITMAGLDATSVSSFRQLCRGCTALTSVDLTDCVMPNMGCVFAMFRNCTNLESIDLTGVDTSSVPAEEVERFATECDNLKWVKIGEKTDIFRKGAEATQAVVDQATWYDSDVNGKVVSTNYLQDVDEAGQYWTHTTAVDKSALEAEYEKDSALIEEEYSESSWAVMAEALKTAETVIADDDATQTQVDEALAALQSAAGQLVALEYTSIDIVYQGETVATVTGEEYKAMQAKVEPTTMHYTSSSEQTVTQRFVPVKELLGEHQPDEGCCIMVSGVNYGSLGTYATELENIYIRHRADTNVYQMAVEGTRGAAWPGGVTSITVGHLYSNGACTICGAQAPEEEPTVSNVTIDTAAISKVYDGEGVTLSVSADVTPDNATVTYQWYKDGNTEVTPVSLLPSDTGANVYALAVNPYSAVTSDCKLAGNVSDSGEYTCTVTASNSAGSASATSSNSVTVSITEATQRIEFTDGTDVAKTTDDETYTNALTDDSVVYGDLSYSISAEDGGSAEGIATIDPASGEVTIIGAGTVVVTATAAGSAEGNYDAVSASYTLTITEPPSYVVKYAVSIWGIKQDKDAEGGTIALTFGPASGASHVNDYVSRETVIEAGGKHDSEVCIHDMSWSEIIAQSEEDPEAFEDCLENGCTTTVDITLKGNLLNESYTGMTGDGDGASELLNSINPSYQKWNYEDDANGGWPASRIRATLNGADESTDVSLAGEDTLTKANCLFACLPEELQGAIVPKAVKSDTDYYYKDGSSTKISYDNLWLFSIREVVAEGEGSFNTSDKMRDHENPGTDTTYQRANNLGAVDTGSSSGIHCYDESGADNGYWYRSLYASSTPGSLASPTVFRSANPMNSESANITGEGIAFGFCLTAGEPPEEPNVSNVTIDTADISRDYNGEGVTLRVSADVTPSDAVVTYKWYKDGETEITPLFLLSSDTGANVYDSAVKPYAAVSSDCNLAGNVSDSGVYTCEVTATNDAGSASAASSNSVTVSITKATQSIEFTDGEEVEIGISEKTYTNALKDDSVVYGDLSYSISAGDDGDVDEIASINEKTGEVTLEGAGTVIVTATAAGDDENYDPASASYTLTITDDSGKVALREEYIVDSMITEGLYSEDTWEPFEAAMEAAEELLENPDATQEDVDEALETLVNARRALTGSYDDPDFTWYTDPAEGVEKYTIATANQMVALSDIVNDTVPEEYEIEEDDFEGDTVTLWDDVMMNPEGTVSYEQPGLDEGVATPVNTSTDEAQIFTPIGNATFQATGEFTPDTYSFKGTFDGGGNKIENLYIKSENGYLGLFGVVGSQNYAEESVDGETAIGDLENFTITGVIECTFDGEASGTELDFVGSACGKITAGARIAYVTNEAVIIAPYCDNVGGIVGFAGTNYKFGGDDKDETSKPSYDENPSGYNTFVECCGNKGIVLGYHKHGGIVGENAATVRYCYNEGWILARHYGSKLSMGGIVGRNGNNGTAKEQSVIAYCYNTGTLTNNGTNDQGIGDQRDFAGISGDNFGGKGENEVYNCYNTAVIPETYNQRNSIASGLDQDANYGYGSFVAVRNNYSTQAAIDQSSGEWEQEKGIVMEDDWFKGKTVNEDGLDVLTCLGPYFVADEDGTLNKKSPGFPVLWWQKEGEEEPSGVAVDLEVLSYPGPTSYLKGDLFDPSATDYNQYYPVTMEVLATYDDGTQGLILPDYGKYDDAHWYDRTQGFSVDVDGSGGRYFPNDKSGEISVDISYGGYTLTNALTFDVK